MDTKIHDNVEYTKVSSDFTPKVGDRFLWVGTGVFLINKVDHDYFYFIRNNSQDMLGMSEGNIRYINIWWYRPRRKILYVNKA